MTMQLKMKVREEFGITAVSYDLFAGVRYLGPVQHSVFINVNVLVRAFNLEKVVFADLRFQL